MLLAAWPDVYEHAPGPAHLVLAMSITALRGRHVLVANWFGGSARSTHANLPPARGGLTSSDEES